MYDYKSKLLLKNTSFNVLLLNTDKNEDTSQHPRFYIYIIK